LLIQAGEDGGGGDPDAVRVHLVMGQNPGPFTLTGTCTYLVGTGRSRLLIDTGEGDRPGYVADLLKTMKETGCDEIAAILCTHEHHDHIGGIADVQKCLGMARRGTRGGGDANSNNDAAAAAAVPIWKGWGGGDDDIVEQQQQPPQNTAAGIVFQTITDGQEFRVEGATLRAVATPGHTRDHMCFVLLPDEEEGEAAAAVVSVFTGDCVLGAGTSVFEDLYTYLQSLQRLLALRPGRLYPGHGPPVPEGADYIRRYVQHRLARERQIVEALQQAAATAASTATSTTAATAASATATASTSTSTSSDDHHHHQRTAAEIVAVVYASVALSPLLQLAARNNVLLHLRKLELEGVVRRIAIADSGGGSTSTSSTSSSSSSCGCGGDGSITETTVPAKRKRNDDDKDNPADAAAAALISSSLAAHADADDGWLLVIAASSSVAAAAAAAGTQQPSSL
jgi:ribonuclease/clavin/mitogillin